MGIQKSMGRPRKGKELRVLLSTRVDATLADEIKEIAGALYGNISAVTEDLIKLGLEDFKKKNHALIRVVEERQKAIHHKELKKGAA